jgi:DNA-binding GntR family transcriptional regulator
VSDEAARPNVTPIRVDSVVSMAYVNLRALILTGDLAPGSRLAQADIAKQLGTSRTPVREALRRLVGDGLVEFHPNRGFRTSDLGLAAVLRRLEVRLIVEPGVAALAAERGTDGPLRAMRDSIEREAAAPTAAVAHDASREFHLSVARATRNEEVERVLDSLWISEVGRRLMTRRAADHDWRHDDVIEHRAILEAVEGRRGEEARQLMAGHIRRALSHWQSTKRPTSG